MANAQVAPLPNAAKTEAEKYPLETAVLSQEYDPTKKYMFELTEVNPERELPVINMRTKRAEPHQKFKPYKNLVFTSQIVWKGQRRMIRYYDGCTTLFVDEQPKDKDTIDQLIKQTARRDFLEGKFGCYGDERMLLMYLNICSWNIESPFRTRTANEIFKSVNPDKVATMESDRLDKIEEALKLAKGASEKKIAMHAAYLEIPTQDYESGNELTPLEIKAAYRKRALENPAKFIESYGDKTLEIRYYIKKALQQGLIHNKENPNKAMLGRTFICDISGIKSQEGIAEKILEHSQLEEGEEFVLQLTALFK